MAETESASFEPMVAASKDAQTYDAAYRHAAAAYARREVNWALAACEDAMALAVALARHVPLPKTLENVTANVEEARMTFVWKELKDMALSRPEAERSLSSRNSGRWIWGRSPIDSSCRWRR